MYNIKFRPRDLAFYSVQKFHENQISTHQISPRGRGQSGHQTIATFGVRRVEVSEYQLDPGAKGEDLRFFKMLLVCFLYFCFSFVILISHFSSESPVTPKGKRQQRERQKLFLKKSLFEFTMYYTYSFSHAPVAFSRHVPRPNLS